MDLVRRIAAIRARRPRKLAAPTMKILAWVAVPLVVTLIAWIVYRIANRPSAPLTPEESMTAHQRLLQVLESPVPEPARPRRGGPARSHVARR